MSIVPSTSHCSAETYVHVFLFNLYLDSGILYEVVLNVGMRPVAMIENVNSRSSTAPSPTHLRQPTPPAQPCPPPGFCSLPFARPLFALPPVLPFFLSPSLFPFHLFSFPPFFSLLLSVLPFTLSHFFPQPLPDTLTLWTPHFFRVALLSHTCHSHAVSPPLLSLSTLILSHSTPLWGEAPW